MHKRSFLYLFLVLVILIFSVANVYAGAVKPKSQGPKIDTMAPDFSLPDSNAKTHKLSDYRGKFVVLEWFNDGCPFVKKHYGSDNMQSLQKKYTAKGVIWLSIVSSAYGRQGYVTAAQANELIKEHNSHASAMLLDPEGHVGQLYRARTTPHIFIINPQGKLIYMGAIDNIRSARAADISRAKNYVSATLDAAMAGKEVEVKVTVPYGCSVKYNIRK